MDITRLTECLEALENTAKAAVSHDGNRDEVNFKLVRVGGLDQLAKDLASML